MAATRHATTRALERCRAAGLEPNHMVTLAALEAKRCGPRESVALKLATLPNHIGEAYGAQSNGNQVWAIIRSRRVVTLMLRRSEQPATRAALRVDRLDKIPMEEG